MQIGGLAAVIGGALLLSRSSPLLHYVTRAQQLMAGMGTLGGALYPLLFAACNVLLLPGGVLALGSGLFFGLWWGAALNIAGSTLGAAIAFTISRYLGRDWVRSHFLRNRKWAALDEAVAREGWKIIFLSQVHPLAPSSLLNYLYGVTRIRFRTCILWVALGQAPGLFLYAYLGTLAQLGLRLLRGATHPHWYEYLFWFGGLAVTVLVTMALGRLALRLLAEAEAQGAAALDQRGRTPGGGGSAEGGESKPAMLREIEPVR